jgi:hypothetical protein
VERSIAPLNLTYELPRGEGFPASNKGKAIVPQARPGLEGNAGLALDVAKPLRVLGKMLILTAV